MAAAGNFMLLAASAAMLVFGTMNVVAKDWQVKLGFFEVQLLIVGAFIAQTCLLPVYYFGTRKTGGEQEEAVEQKPPAPFHAYAVTSLFFFSYLALKLAAYRGLPGSILQMTNGCKLCFTALFSVTILGHSLRRHHYCGVCLNVFGIMLVGLAALGIGVGWATQSQVVQATIWALSSCVFGALHLIWQEKTLKQYSVAPELLVGMEGLLGTGYSLVALLLGDVSNLTCVPCALANVWQHKLVLCAFLLSLFAVTTFNYSALIVTQKSNAMVNSLLDVGRALFIWAIEVNLQWVKFSSIELLGFFIMVSGTTIYTKLLVCPFLTAKEEVPLIEDKAKTNV